MGDIIDRCIIATPPMYTVQHIYGAIYSIHDHINISVRVARLGKNVCIKNFCQFGKDCQRVYVITDMGQKLSGDCC